MVEKQQLVHQMVLLHIKVVEVEVVLEERAQNVLVAVRVQELLMVQ